MKDGGPAFPREDYQTDNALGQRGMSLRDYFAARALQGILSGPALLLVGDNYLEGVAAAYQIADAMLEEREK